MVKFKFKIIDISIGERFDIQYPEWRWNHQIQLGLKHYKKGYQFNCKNYCHFQILYIVKGAYHIETPQFKQVLYPGKLVILKLGCDYNVSCPDEDCEVVSYVISGDHREEYIGDAMVTGEDRSINKLVDLIMASIDYRHSINISFLELLGQALLNQTLFVSSCSTAKSHSDHFAESMVKRGKALIDSSLSSGKAIQEIFAGLGISYRQISRYFHDIEGMSPKQYQLETRMKEVREMLEREPENIARIAYELGFSSAQHLSKQFKDFHGLSPIEYRNKHS